MGNTTLLNVPADFSKVENYTESLEEYENTKMRNKFLCYNSKTKKCFVSVLFEKKNVESWYKSISIIK